MILLAIIILCSQPELPSWSPFGKQEIENSLFP